MSANTIRVIAAVVDTRQLTLYKEDGSTEVILQGDARLAPIIQAITPVLAGMPGAVAEIDISQPFGQSPYQEFESLVGKAIRFFRIAKPKLTKIFTKFQGGETAIVPPQVIGVLPSQKEAPPTSPASEHLLSITEEIIKHAKPSDDPQFHGEGTDDHGTDTIVAVVGNQVVADIQNLKPQLIRAVASNSSAGMQNFLNRIAAVAGQRRHSVEDLLKFMSKGDLPVADDGSIIIYKVLKRNHEQKRWSSYVDLHSRKVLQRVGSYVCMDPSLVDHDRHVECSNGLHVARRSYISQFPGDVCVLAKVKPEDVIAVPEQDPDKMRVCGYHILFELPEEAYAKLRTDQPFTDNEVGQLLLGRALSGQHGKPIEEVRITQSHGGGLIITPYLEAPTIDQQIVAEVAKPVAALSTELEEDAKAPAVDPKAVVKEVAAEKAKAETRAEKAQKIYSAYTASHNDADRRANAIELLAFKKSAKLGWGALGLPDLGTELQEYVGKH